MGRVDSSDAPRVFVEFPVADRNLATRRSTAREVNGIRGAKQVRQSMNGGELRVRIKQYPDFSSTPGWLECLFYP
jgi:hypothetical protein